MAFSFKRYAALAAALACTVSVAGCDADNGYIGTIDGYQVRNGVYLLNMTSAYDTAYSNMTIEKEDSGDTSEITDFFSQTVDGVNAEEWIKDEALDLTKRFVAVELMFESRGLTLDEEQVSLISENIKETWDSESINYYGFAISVKDIYGYPTMGDYYESVGIGKDSLKDVQLNSMKADKLLIDVFTNVDELKVSDEEIDKFLSDKYTNVKYIEVPFHDVYGLNLDVEDDADEIAALKEKTQNYVDRINNGESFIEVKYEQDLIDAQNEAYVAAEDALDVEGAEQPEDVDAYLEEAKNAATADKADTIEELETVIKKDSSSLPTEVTNFAWETPADGKAHYCESSNGAYVIIREDITTKTQWKEDNMAYILSELVGEDFDDYLRAEYDNYELSLDQNLIDNKYAPSTYKGIVRNYL